MSSFVKRILEPAAKVRVLREEVASAHSIAYTILCEEEYIRLLIGRQGMTAKTLRSMVLLMERAYSGKKATLKIEKDLGYLHKIKEESDGPN